MSQIEAAAKPLLTQLAAGESLHLGVADQETLAAWFTKTGMMLDFATHAADIPRHNYRKLFQTRLPPDFAAVLSCSFAAKDGRVPHLNVIQQNGYITPIWGTANGGSRVGRQTRYYVQTLKLGLVVAQVFWANDANLSYHYLASRTSRALIRLWPKPAPQEWPTARLNGWDAYLRFGKRLSSWGAS
jgi:hypothetical protein